MNKKILKKLLACPQCKNILKPFPTHGSCKKCGYRYTCKHAIWQFLRINEKQTYDSHKAYEYMHKKNFGGPIDGSYKILASIAKGNKTVDIACGEGIIESMAPETVGVEFSLNALRKAKKNGAKYLVLADAHALPFKNDAFDMAISNGNLEHFANPQKAINEMARVSKMQVMTVHQYPPVPFASFLFKLFTLFFQIKHQPIEKPMSYQSVSQMMEKAGLKIIYKGAWTLPFNYGNVIPFLPEFKNISSVFFVFSIKK